jgi:peptidyl-prolyl cis-trans isomerase C
MISGSWRSIFESQWHRPPTQQEFVGLVEAKVREEILYREALAMGLDKRTPS